MAAGTTSSSTAPRAGRRAGPAGSTPAGAASRRAAAAWPRPRPRVDNRRTNYRRARPRRDMGQQARRAPGAPDVAAWLKGYDPKDLTIATAVSHSSLQIFHGARLEGFRTLGIAAGGRDVRYYDAFPQADRK